MNTEALFLFLILLLGLVLCSFLGGNCGSEGFTSTPSTSCTSTSTNPLTSSSGAATSSPVVGDNYNHVSGSMTSLQAGSTLYGPNGAKIVVVQNSDGTQSLDVTLPNGKTIKLDSKKQEKSDSFIKTTSTLVEKYTNYYGTNGTATTFYGPNGVTASVIKGNNGQNAIHVKTSEGNYTFTPNSTYYNPTTDSTNSNSSTQYYGSTGYQVDTYKGAYGGSAGAVTGPADNTAYYAQGPNGTTSNGTNPYYDSAQYYGPNGGSAGAVTGPNGGPNGGSTGAVTGPNGGSTGAVTGPAYGGQGNTAYGGSAGAYGGSAGAYGGQGSNGNAVAGTTNYSSSLPPGIPASQIPSGDEDLYILKSQVVPPVCPVCPATDNMLKSLQEIQSAKCQPCPAPQRCPEPSFECKKVPNYNAIGNNELPIPVLNDFSTFGM